MGAFQPVLLVKMLAALAVVVLGVVLIMRALR